MRNQVTIAEIGNGMGKHERNWPVSGENAEDRKTIPDKITSNQSLCFVMEKE